MDPLSQAALGAAWAQPASRPERVLAATATGAVGGMAPDLDVLIRSASDPLLAIEFHRHFTHSLAFIPFGALLCALLVFPLARAVLPFSRCYGFSLLGYASHGLLDACTSYGTLLLWPFSHVRIAWDVVSVIDPLFTLPVLACVVFAAWRGRPTVALAGVAWCVFYLGLGLLQNHRATTVVLALAASRGHTPERIAVKPSFANVIVWKSLYEHDGIFYVDAVRAGIDAVPVPGVTIARLDVSRDFPWLDRDSQQWRDLERFRWFADGWLGVSPDEPRRVVDIRYSLVPNSTAAFWGLELDPGSSAESHASYVTMRTRSPAEGRILLRMIAGFEDKN